MSESIELDIETHSANGNIWPCYIVIKDKADGYMEDKADEYKNLSSL